MSNEEVWRPVLGYDGYYEVSSHGKVRSMSRLVYDSLGRRPKMMRGRVLSPSHRKSGHLNVNLKVDGSSLTKPVHVLVLESFVGPCPPGMECCHGDGNPVNNYVENLRWDTRAANIQDALRHGTHSQASKTHCPQGHEYTPENTLPSKGGRRCRECHRIKSSKRFYARDDVQHGTHLQSRKTHCDNGHPFSEENTRISPRGRICRICEKVRNARSQAAKKTRLAA